MDKIESLKNAALIEITAEMIRQLINDGVIYIHDLDGSATVRRMWVGNHQGVAGILNVVVEGEGLPATTDRTLVQTADCELRTELPPSDGHDAKKARTDRKLHELLLLERLVEECTNIYPSQWFVDGNDIHCFVQSNNASYMFSHPVRFMLLDTNPCAYAHDVIDELRLWYGKTVLNQECNAG